MRILLACEESQAVTKEFRKLGHEVRGRMEITKKRKSKTKK